MAFTPPLTVRSRANDDELRNWRSASALLHPGRRAPGGVCAPRRVRRLRLHHGTAGRVVRAGALLHRPPRRSERSVLRRHLRGRGRPGPYAADRPRRLVLHARRRHAQRAWRHRGHVAAPGPIHRSRRATRPGGLRDLLPGVQTGHRLVRSRRQPLVALLARLGGIRRLSHVLGHMGHGRDVRGEGSRHQGGRRRGPGHERRGDRRRHERRSGDQLLRVALAVRRGKPRRVHVGAVGCDEPRDPVLEAARRPAAERRAFRRAALRHDGSRCRGHRAGRVGASPSETQPVGGDDSTITSRS